MSENELRPWDVWVQNNPDDPRRAKPIEEPIKQEEPPQQVNIGMPSVREVKPWDLLNPNKEKTDDALQEERLSICKKCPSYRKFAKQCKECGCIMPAKVKLAEAFCPLGKWAAVTPAEEKEQND
jgi:hypothetical protein